MTLRRLSSFILSLLAVLLFAVIPSPAAKTTLYGKIDEWASLCNAAGIKLNGATVEKVMLGTPAYYSGLRANDKLVNCVVEDKKLKLTFERDGKRYGATIATHPAAMVPTSSKTTIATSASEQQALNKLKDYDIIIFVDCSGSMNDPIASESLRKWDWARKHIQDFNEKFNATSQRQITLVMFNDKFNVIPHCTMSDLQKVFDRQQPDGGTDLAEPLSTIINERLNDLDKRPCVIVVLHDGVPENEYRVRQVLQRTADKLFSPGKLHITFIQIGDDADGAQALQDWEKSNESLVTSELFPEVKNQGLAKSIADAIDRLKK